MFFLFGGYRCYLRCLGTCRKWRRRRVDSIILVGTMMMASVMRQRCLQSGALIVVLRRTRFRPHAATFSSQYSWCNVERCLLEGDDKLRFTKSWNAGLDGQNVNVSSSAIKMTGGPPDEIFTALAKVCLPPADSAHAWSASMDGKCTSATR